MLNDCKVRKYLTYRNKGLCATEKFVVDAECESTPTYNQTDRISYSLSLISSQFGTCNRTGKELVCNFIHCSRWISFSYTSYKGTLLFICLFVCFVL